MDLSQAPSFVAAKLAQLFDARAAAAMRSDELPAQISDVRDRLNGRVVRQGDHPAELRIELDRLLAEQKALQAQRPIEMGIIEDCKAWLAALPGGTVLKQVIPDTEDGLSLSVVRTRIKGLQESVSALKRVPIPPSNVQEKILSYVQSQTRPIVSGIASGEALTVQWPTSLHALLAFVQPDVLVERLMAEINRVADTPCALPEREQRIAELEQQIDRLQRAEEAVVIATGALRERGCPPWVVLGVKAVEARSVCAT